MADFLPTAEMELQAWLNNFYTVADTNATVLGITPAEMTTLSDNVTDFANTLSTVETRRGAFESAVTAKNMQRKQTVTDVRDLVKRIQANRNVGDALKSSLGITVPSGAKTRTTPVTPFNLIARPYASGINEILWDKAGNKPSTQFIIECKPAVGGDWQYIARTSASRFQHVGQTPGRALFYRVTAERSDLSSQPSEAVGVYGG